MKKLLTKQIVLPAVAGILILALAAACLYFFLENRGLRDRLETARDLYSPEYTNFNSLTVSTFREMVASGEDFIVSIGRPTCPDCRAFEPELINIAADLGLMDKIYYLNVGMVRSSSNDDEWKAFKASVGFMYTPALARYSGGGQVSLIEWDESGLTGEQARNWLIEQTGTAA